MIVAPALVKWSFVITSNHQMFNLTVYCTYTLWLQHWWYFLLYWISIGAVVTVDNTVDYTIVEDSGVVNITLLLDQSSCRLITIIASPQESSPASATGNYKVTQIGKFLCMKIFLC